MSDLEPDHGNNVLAMYFLFWYLFLFWVLFCFCFLFLFFLSSPKRSFTVEEPHRVEYVKRIIRGIKG